MDAMMQLVVGWTLVGGFVFTVVVTCLSLVGWVRFADPAQQRRLFTVVILELVVGVGGTALGLWRLDPGPVEDGIHDQGFDEGQVEGVRAFGVLLEQRLEGPVPAPQREALIQAFEGLELQQGSSADAARAELLKGLRTAPDDAAFGRTLRDTSRFHMRRP